MLQAAESSRRLDTTERLNGSRTAPGWAVHTVFLGNERKTGVLFPFLRGLLEAGGP